MSEKEAEKGSHAMAYMVLAIKEVKISYQVFLFFTVKLFACFLTHLLQHSRDGLVWRYLLSVATRILNNIHE